jgi:hypothetical protein
MGQLLQTGRQEDKGQGAFLTIKSRETLVFVVFMEYFRFPIAIYDEQEILLS